MSSAEIIINCKGLDYMGSYDLQDHELVTQYNWKLHSKGYAYTSVNRKTILMHRLILGLTNTKVEAEHRNHYKLNNCRSNLRVCSHSQNMMNIRKFHGQSQFKGVYRDFNKYHVQFMVGNRVANLGRYRPEITAAKVYDREVRNLFGEFAKPNFPEHFEPLQPLIIPSF